jgi:hypothetical protein
VKSHQCQHVKKGVCEVCRVMRAEANKHEGVQLFGPGHQPEKVRFSNIMANMSKPVMFVKTDSVQAYMMAAKAKEMGR